MVRRTLLLATAVMLAATMGCTPVQRWAAGGAAAGAAVGGIWASHAMGALSQGHAALVGASVGGLTGALIGDMLDDEEVSGADPDELARLQEENRNLRAQLQAKDQELANAMRRIKELEDELARCKGKTSMEIEYTIPADTLFRPGSARLSDEGRQTLDEAAQKLQQQSGNLIMIEGHTDSQPIRLSKWKSNWELGAARSLTVLHYLEDKGVDSAKLSASTFSEYHPVADNGSADGRSQNRRAAIVVYSNWRPASGGGGGQ